MLHVLPVAAGEQPTARFDELERRLAFRRGAKAGDRRGCLVAHVEGAVEQAGALEECRNGRAVAVEGHDRVIGGARALEAETATAGGSDGTARWPRGRRPARPGSGDTRLGEWARPVRRPGSCGFAS